MPVSRYVGIERMTAQYASELIKEHQVSVLGNSQSIYAEGVKLYGIEASGDSYTDELKQFQSYQYLLRQFDVIHDWSHLHLASRFMHLLPSLNLFFHAPSLAQYPKSPYNIISFSKWAAKEFKRVYHQEARYQQSIGIPDIYKLPDKPRGNRFLAVGRMGQEKGNHIAAEICKLLDVSLDIVGGRGFETNPNAPPTEYEKLVLSFCDGVKIRCLGEVSEEAKIELMQSCAALIYATDHPEVTSHKIQEAVFCGAPAIVPNLGAIPEIVTHGVNGFLCRDKTDYIAAIMNLNKLKPMEAYDAFIDKYSISKVVERYIPLYKSVALGEHWA